MGLLDRLRGDDGPRVAFFGIDGVPFSLVDEHPDVFTNLHTIMADGAGGPIDSIVPPESSACWPALTCGVNPGRTGVYGFQDRAVGSYETYIPLGRHVRATRLWDRVGEAGREASVLNVPVTFPPDEAVQRMVSGFLSPGVEAASHPESFGRQLADAGYRIDVDASLGHADDTREFLEDAHAVLDARAAAFEDVIDRDDWDLFVGVFMTTDRVNHFLFGDYERGTDDREAFLAFYRRLDDHLGTLYDRLPEDVTTIIASDHGFTTLEHEVHLNAWLEREGWLSFETADTEELGDIDDDTRAYSLIPGRLFLNLDGREPRGSVAEDDYDATRDELRAMLEGLEGPDGETVIDRVVDGEEAFEGPHVDIAPDLVAIPANGFDLKAGFTGDDDVYTGSPRNGMHTFANATLIADDPAIDPAGADLLDVAPTVLEAMDIELTADELEGRSLFT
ncbi:MAG: alkaline phosphatase family protein [Halobacteriales archaeon]